MQACPKTRSALDSELGTILTHSRSWWDSRAFSLTSCFVMMYIAVDLTGNAHLSYCLHIPCLYAYTHCLDVSVFLFLYMSFHAAFLFLAPFDLPPIGRRCIVTMLLFFVFQF